MPIYYERQFDLKVIEFGQFPWGTYNQFGSNMNKAKLLYTIDAFDYADAVEIAETLELNYSSVAMGLLRLVRQDLATRHMDPDAQRFIYELTPKGEARLDYLLEDEFDDC